MMSASVVRRVRRLPVLLAVLASGPLTAPAQPPSAPALIERFDREKSPVWADGDTATFFFRGEAANVDLIAGGDFKSLTRVPSSDVWTVSITLPDLEQAVISYEFTAANPAGSPKAPVRRSGVWRGAKAPPAAVQIAELKGSLKSFEIESKALEARRKVSVYLPPGFQKSIGRRALYAIDGENIDRFVRVLEPLVTSGELSPIVVVGVHSGGYLRGADDSQSYDTKKDLRAQEYFPGINPDRFARHELFFCSEVVDWAEREWNVSKDSEDRALFGCSNGGRFVFEMAVRHPDRFGHVLAFAVPGRAPVTLPEGFKTSTHFYLEAGTWETAYHLYTSQVAGRLRELGARVEFRARVGGHDEAIWRDEFAIGLVREFGPNRK